MLRNFTKFDISNLDKYYRINLINSFLGVKPAILVGTVDEAGKHNLAIFSQVFHVGANPPLIGMLFRPDTVERHTLSNLRATKSATINLVPTHLYKQAHWTSARFETSEFDACGFTPEWRSEFTAPFVAESTQKCAVSLVELTEIKANGTWLAILVMEFLIIEEENLHADGFLDCERGSQLSVAGLDAYYKSALIGRLAYAKPDKLPEDLRLITN
jgi:flavin reductase (DIM6/NTAB) family NADH-FMN oxidoreductase RutF